MARPPAQTPFGGQDLFASIPEAKTTPANEAAWLSISHIWIAPTWEPVKVLGSGGFGIVGLFEHVGQRHPRSPQFCCVKQSIATGKRDDLRNESTRLFDLMEGRRSKHIPEIYRELQTGIGSGTGPLDKGSVHRMHFEYCPGGDLAQVLSDNSRMPLHELDLWEIFHCLSLATLCLKWGSETLPILSGTIPLNIVHFDLKTHNILIGAKTVDREHFHTTPYKIGDFGLAERFGDFTEPQSHRDYEYCGTVDYLTPEQLSKNYRDKDYQRPWAGRVPWQRYGPHTNVWGLGMIMWVALHGEGPNFTEDQFEKTVIYQSILSNRLRTSGETVGTRYDIEMQRNMLAGSPSRDGYSRRLQAVIAECLLLDGKARPTPEELVNITKEGLEAARPESSTANWLKGFEPIIAPPLRSINSPPANLPIFPTKFPKPIPQREPGLGDTFMLECTMTLPNQPRGKGILHAIISRVSFKAPPPAITTFAVNVFVTIWTTVRELKEKLRVLVQPNFPQFGKRDFAVWSCDVNRFCKEEDTCRMFRKQRRCTVKEDV